MPEQQKMISSLSKIEKMGYGFSDISNSPRDMETVLEEIRKVLAQEIKDFIVSIKNVNIIKISKKRKSICGLINY